MNIYNNFEQWFNELEGFGFRSERLYESLPVPAGAKLRESLETWLRAAFEAGQTLAHSKQARIDELMLEYCPDEITDEQWDEYSRHQVSVGPEFLDAYNSERLVSKYDKGATE